MQADTERRRLLLTIPEAARRLGVSRDWAYQEAAAGHLPVVRLGDRPGRGQVLRVPSDQLDAWISERGLR